MRPRDKLPFLILACCVVVPSEAFLLPLLFPVSIKITFHSSSKPTPPPEPSYHFDSVPVYREVVVKGSAHISPPKYSYGDGQKYGTSYGDGHIKVYTEEPHIRGHKYAKGYGSTAGSGAYIDGHFSVSSKPVAPPTTHYKGSPYDSDSGAHYKGGPYAQTDGHIDPGSVYVSDGDVPQTHIKGTPYDGSTHYKGTSYEDTPTHYKGTSYEDTPTHYKGTPYEDTPTHYKGTSYEDVPTHYKGSPYDNGPKGSYPRPHSYIKPVGGYKVSDYISAEKTTGYEKEEGESYVVVPPGKTYAEIEAAHKVSHHPKAYAADQYSDLGSKKYNKEYEHDASYIDDTLPVFKANIPRPRTYRYQASASRYDRVLPPPPPPEQPASTGKFAGFGTSIYGDSYAKITYVPKSLRISIRAYRHK